MSKENKKSLSLLLLFLTLTLLNMDNCKTI